MHLPNLSKFLLRHSPFVVDKAAWTLWSCITSRINWVPKYHHDEKHTSNFHHRWRRKTPSLPLSSRLKMALHWCLRPISVNPLRLNTHSVVVWAERPLRKVSLLEGCSIWRICASDNSRANSRPDYVNPITTEHLESHTWSVISSASSNSSDNPPLSSSWSDMNRLGCRWWW